MRRFDRRTTFQVVLIIFLISSALIVIPNLPKSYAHTYIDDSIPASLQSLNTPPSKIDVYFTDPIDIKYSQIRVLDTNGKEVQDQNLHYITDDTKAVCISLQPGLSNEIDSDWFGCSFGFRFCNDCSACTFNQRWNIRCHLYQIWKHMDSKNDRMRGATWNLLNNILQSKKLKITCSKRFSHVIIFHRCCNTGNNKFDLSRCSYWSDDSLNIRFHPQYSCFSLDRRDFLYCVHYSTESEASRQ